MATKATHTGECQICGSRQMLPGGVLAKHGYTTRWGFFSGVCSGSGHLPYELSCEQIQRNIDAVKAQAVRLRALAAETRTQADPNDCWIHPYVRSENRNIQSGYKWVKSAIRNNDRTLQQCVVTEQYVVGKGWVKTEKWERLDVYGRHEEGLYDIEARAHNLENVARHLNGQYAKMLEGEAAQCDQYVEWATPRITNWTLKPLTPRK